MNKSAQNGKAGAAPAPVKEAPKNGQKIEVVSDPSKIIPMPKQEEAKPVSDFAQKVETALSVEQVIERNANLGKLIEKRTKIVARKSKLQSFKLAGDVMTATMTIQDAHGNEFTSSHSGLINEAMDLLQGKIDSTLSEVNAQILTY